MTAAVQTQIENDVIFFNSIRGCTVWAEWLTGRAFYYIGPNLHYTSLVDLDGFLEWARKRDNITRYGREDAHPEPEQMQETESSFTLRDRKNTFLALFEEGATLRDIADHLACDMKAFYRWADADPNFARSWAQLKTLR